MTPRSCHEVDRQGGLPSPVRVWSLLVAYVVACTTLVAGAVESSAWPSMAETEVPGKLASAARAYIRTPRGTRARLTRFTSQVNDATPAWITILVADANLRMGRWQLAESLFASVPDRSSGSGMATYALLGVGWSVLTGGDMSAARGLFNEVAMEKGPVGDVGHLMTLLLSSDEAHAGEALDALVADERRDPQVRTTALLAACYVRLWDQAGPEARLACARASAVLRGHRLGDEAAYGSIRAELLYGEPSKAWKQAQEIGRSTTSVAAAPDLMALERAALLRSAVRRYRRSKVSLQNVAALVEEGLDINGRRLAAAALRVDNVPIRASGPFAVGFAEQVDADPAPERRREAVLRRHETRSRLLVGMVLLGLLIVAIRARRAVQR